MFVICCICLSIVFSCFIKVSTFLKSTLTEVAQATDVAGEVAAVEWSADGRASPYFAMTC